MNDKQLRFVEEYLVDLNATQAAIRAGYSAKTAYSQGERLLRHVEVARAITERKTDRSVKTGIDAQWVLMRLAGDAEADLADLYDDAGGLKPIHEWPVAFRKGLVAGVEVEELFEGQGENRTQIGRVRKIRLADRLKVVELIGKHVDVQAFKERIDHGLTDDLAAAIMAGNARVAGA
nr:terminase small subunit [Novosphingobium sp. SG751A]